MEWVNDDEGDEEVEEGARVVRLLDYACGTGLVSKVCWNPSLLILSSHCRFSIVGWCFNLAVGS